MSSGFAGRTTRASPPDGALLVNARCGALSLHLNAQSGLTRLRGCLILPAADNCQMPYLQGAFALPGEGQKHSRKGMGTLLPHPPRPQLKAQPDLRDQSSRTARRLSGIRWAGWRVCTVLPPAGEFRFFRSFSSHGNLLVVARRGRLAVGGWLGAPAAGARTVGMGFGATWPRARPTPLPAEPGCSGPAWRYGSLRASAAAAFCPAGDGNGQSGSLL